MSPSKPLAIALAALLVAAAIPAATIEDSGHIASFDDIAPGRPAPRPAASIADSAGITTLDDVAPPRQAPKPAAPRPAARSILQAPARLPLVARAVVRAAEVVAKPARPAQVATQAEPGIPQPIRHVPAPVVTLEPGAAPTAGRAAVPVVTLPPG